MGGDHRGDLGGLAEAVEEIVVAHRIVGGHETSFRLQ
jgi:hypothetical protein